VTSEIKAFLKRYRIEFIIASIVTIAVFHIVYHRAGYERLKDFFGDNALTYKIILAVFMAVIFLVAWISYPKIYKFKILLSSAALVSFLFALIIIYINMPKFSVFGLKFNFYDKTWIRSGKFILFFIITLLNINLLMIMLVKASITYSDGQKLALISLGVNLIIIFIAIYAISGNYLGSDGTRFSTKFIKSFNKQFVPFNFLIFIITVLFSFFSIEEEHNYGSIVVAISIICFYCVITAEKVYPVRMITPAMAIILIVGMFVHWVNCLHHKAHYDPLLKIYNRQYMQGIIDGIVDVKLGPRFSVLMCDIDHFKKINDNYGHATGDIVLYKIAQIIRETSLPEGIVCRYGGEEIIVFLRDKTGDEAKLKAERIRKAVKKSGIKAKSRSIKVTVSIGVASTTKGIDAVKRVIKRADESVYKAKKRGRDKVVLET